MRRQPMEREKIFKEHISDKAQRTKIYEKLIHLNNNKKFH